MLIPAFLAPLWTLVGGFKGLFIAGALASVVLIGRGYVNEYDRRGQAEGALSRAVSALEGRLRVSVGQQAVDRVTIDTLNASISRNTKSLQENCALLDDLIKSTAPGADAPVGEPIGTLLERLK